MTRLRNWLYVVVWAGLISTLSTDAFSSQHTGRIILVALQAMLPHASAGTLDLLHLLIRKCAHLLEYFMFSLLLMKAIRAERPEWKVRWAILALVIAASYAGLDEFHQSFVPSRTASGWDVLLDTSGASMAQIAVWIALKRRRETLGEPKI